MEKMTGKRFELNEGDLELSFNQEKTLNLFHLLLKEIFYERKDNSDEARVNQLLKFSRQGDRYRRL